MQIPGKKNSDYYVILLILLWILSFTGCPGPGNVKKQAIAPKTAQKPETEKIPAALVKLAQNMENKNLIYSGNPEDFRDCSGIFHRIIRKLKEKFPGIDIPQPKYRSSRDIARWYNNKARLIPVTNALLQDNLIKPGSVMFYGHNKKHYNYVDKKTVIRQTEHLGIVMEVTKNDKNQVESYRLFHGRSKGKPAAITNFHKRKSYPPLGNGAQQWIGMAFITKSPLSEYFVKSTGKSYPAPELIKNEVPDSRAQKPFVQRGLASWYSRKLNGRKTASGEPYNYKKYTAAHKFLPFGAKVKVTDLETGKSVVVRINDRGPYSKKRIIDISEAAARKIGLIKKGIAKVKIENIK